MSTLTPNATADFPYTPLEDVIYSYSDLTPSNPTVAQALAVLRPHLPVSLPVYRRLQTGHFTSGSTLLTNFDFNAAPKPNIDEDDDDEANAGQIPWLVTFLDRTRRPETEALLFGSWETSRLPPPAAPIPSTSSHPQHARSPSNSDETTPPPTPTPTPTTRLQTLLSQLLRTIAALPCPPSMHTPISTPSPTLLFGALHTRTLPHILAVAPSPDDEILSNDTFIWDVSSADALHAAAQSELPAGLSWGQVRRRDYALVRSRTAIKRQDRTLAECPSVAVFPSDTTAAVEGGGEDGAPVAWVFLGLDASLTSLHVEEGHRRRGLARRLTAKIFTEEMGRWWEGGVTRWAHGYVVEGNEGSGGMCRGLGGKAEWGVYWARVDVAAV